MNKLVINIDYSKIEERVIALLKDKTVEDKHSALAKELFGNNYTKDQRTYCKRLNYFTAYSKQTY